MATPNLSEIAATSIQARSRELADNVTKQNALLAKMRLRGNIKPFDGGENIVQEFSFAENANKGWYTGSDVLPIASQDVLSGAVFAIKQAAVPVTINGLEEIQNAGKERMIGLLDARLEVAESTMFNLLAEGSYSDGTGTGGKQLTGLGAAVPSDPTTGSYGGIDRSLAANVFWRSQILNSGGLNAATIFNSMNQLAAKCTRGKDYPDLVAFDNNLWATFLAGLQNLQRFVNVSTAKLGFPSCEFMGMDVVLDGGIGGFQSANIGHFINTKYIFLRPFKDRDMVPIGGKRYATNQDAQVQILGWAGNMTSNGPQFSGKLNAN